MSSFEILRSVFWYFHTENLSVPS